MPPRQNHEGMADVAEPYARYLRLPGIGGVGGRTFLSWLGVVRFFDLRSVKLPQTDAEGPRGFEKLPLERRGETSCNRSKQTDFALLAVSH